MNEGLKDKILKLRKDGLSYNDIQTELNCSKGTISYHCSKNNLGNLNNVSPTEIEIEQMQKIYDTYKNVNKVSELTKWNKSTVLKYVQTFRYSEIERKDRRVKSVVYWRQRVKRELVEYKGGKCIICGYDKCIRSLGFHHTDQTKKDFSISGKSWSFDKLKKEVDKTILVCNNCHGEIHDGLIDISNIRECS